MKQHFRSRLPLIFLALAVLGLAVAGAVQRDPKLEAGIWRQFSDYFFVSPATSTAPAAAGPATSSVPLYKPALDFEKAVIEAVKRASPAVVSITISRNVPIIEQCPYNPFPNDPELRGLFGDLPQFFVPCTKGSELQEVGGGSGFIVSANGLVVTNKHVVADAAASYTVFTNDGKKYPATVLGRDAIQDIAILKVESQDALPVVSLGNSGSIELGQTAIAIGNALGEFRNTVSLGVISGLSRTVTASDRGGFSETISGVIQTDAAINPGNSGGPLLNLRGEVIGINTAVASQAQNIGFAIPVNRAKRIIESVKRSGEIQTAFLGVRYVLVTKQLAERETLGVDYGALLRKSQDGPAVSSGSPAEQAGLREGDVILELNGKRIETESTLLNLIAEREVGEVVRLTVFRDGKQLEIRVTLGKRSN